MGADGAVAVVRQVQVTLADSAELEVSASTDEVYGGCICADEARTFRWGVRATSLGTEHRGHGGIPLPCCLGTPSEDGVGREDRSKCSATWEALLCSTFTFPIAS